MLSSDRALAHYDVNRPVKLFFDASAYGLGACLVHIMDDGSLRPIAYASRTLSKPERAYAQIEREGIWGSSFSPISVWSPIYTGDRSSSPL